MRSLSFEQIHYRRSLWQSLDARLDGAVLPICLSYTDYFSNTFFTSPILLCTLPPAFSMLPRSRRSGFRVALPVSSFTFPLASLKAPLILSFVLDFIKSQSRARL